MKFSDETLMAFADGELNEPERSAVARAVAEDPQVAALVARHQALRAKVSGAFAGVMDEPLPGRLRPAPADAVGTRAAGAKVVRLDAVRAARAESGQAPLGEASQQPSAVTAPGGRASRGWAQWGGMAAALVVGVLAGIAGMQAVQPDPMTSLASRDGALVAQGELERALSQQLASAPPAGAAVRINASFVDQEGAYCRSFTFGATAGLACRAGERWQVPVVVEGKREGAADYRQAGSALPPALLDAIDARIAGQALDAGAERAAQQRGWQR